MQENKVGAQVQSKWPGVAYKGRLRGGVPATTPLSFEKLGGTTGNVHLPVVVPGVKRKENGKKKATFRGDNLVVKGDGGEAAQC